MNYRKRIKIWLSVLQSFLISFPGIHGRFLCPEDTVNELLSKRSLIRFGDGEFGIFRGKDIHYQKWSPDLQKAFEAIKNEYEAGCGNCPYLLAMPRKFLTVSGFKLMKRRVYVSSWAESRRDFKRNFRHNIPYGDSFLFEKKNKPIYSRIWESDTCPENVIFIHNDHECAANFENTYRKKVMFIQCPPRDAFEQLGSLERHVMRTIEENQWMPENVMLTISAGPAGKVLTYRLSKKGYWCIDAGHCWDDPLEGI